LNDISLPTGYAVGDDNSGYTCGVDWDQTRWANLAPRLDRYDASNVGYDGATYFGSAHASGFTVAACDGSVRTVRYDVQSNFNGATPNDYPSFGVFQRFAVRNDGQAVNLNDL
jgi:hypothetical protein